MTPEDMTPKDKRPIQTSPLPAVAKQSAKAFKHPSSMADVAQNTLATLGRYGAADGAEPPGQKPEPQAQPDAAAGQPATAPLPSPAEVPPLGAGLSMRLEKACTVQLDPLWFARLSLLATRAGVDPARYVEGLIKTKWVLGPMDHPIPR